jgi:hypothetical protein
MMVKVLDYQALMGKLIVEKKYLDVPSYNLVLAGPTLGYGL